MLLKPFTKEKLSELKNHFEISSSFLELSVDSMIRNEKFEIRNSTLKHAKLLIYLLISRAKDEVVIFSNDLDKRCYDDLYIQAALKKAKDDGVKISAIVLDGENIAKIFRDLQIPVKSIDMKKNPNKALLENHFLVCDNEGYRWESKHKKCIDLVSARVNFNNPLIATPLKSVFDDLLACT